MQTPDTRFSGLWAWTNCVQIGILKITPTSPVMGKSAPTLPFLGQTGPNMTIQGRAIEIADIQAPIGPNLPRFVPWRPLLGRSVAHR